MPVFCLLAFSFAFGDGVLVRVLVTIAFFGPIFMLTVLTVRRRQAFSSREPDLSATALALLYLIVFLFYTYCFFYFIRGLASAA